MATGGKLEREEYIEQAYFFRILRERLVQAQSTQELLERIDQEILATTRLPYAIQFLAGELKHTGLLSVGFRRLTHYFTPYQGFIVEGTEDETRRFNLDTGLLVLEREAKYRADRVSQPGLFVYQFEVICRNRLGYDAGLEAMAADPFYDPAWVEFFKMLRSQVGLIDFGELVYLRSEYYVLQQRRTRPDYEPPVPPLFGEKEGRIAQANRGKDPLYLFSALQRQLDYPEVPRPRPRDDLGAKLDTLQARLRDLEARLHLVESELKGQVDLGKLGKPELLSDQPEIEL